MKPNKEITIKNIIAEHEQMRKAVKLFSDKDLIEKKISGPWTVKDILAHLCGWNWEWPKEIDRVLNNASTWDKLYATEEGDNAFNLKQVEKRKGISFTEVFEEWEKSYESLIKKMESLNDEQWFYTSTNDKWNSGDPVSVYSLFMYESEGHGHEKSHAEEIEKLLNHL